MLWWTTDSEVTNSVIIDMLIREDAVSSYPMASFLNCCDQDPENRRLSKSAT